MEQSFSASHGLPSRFKPPTQLVLLSRILFVIHAFEQVEMGGSPLPDGAIRSTTCSKQQAPFPRYNPQSDGVILIFKAIHLSTTVLVWALLVGSVGCRSSMGPNGTGVSLFQQGRYAEALQVFQQAKQVDPANPDVHYNLASTYHRLGANAKDAKMMETAEALYNQCLDLSPNHVDCHRGLAVLLVDTGRSDRAFALLKNWTQRSPTLSDARVELARLHQEFNQSKVAEQYLDEALAMDPRNPNAWAAKGKLRENSGELMQAVQNYQQSLAINASQPDLYQRISALNVRIAQGTPNPNSPSVIAGNAGAPGNNTSPSSEPKRY